MLPCFLLELTVFFACVHDVAVQEVVQSNTYRLSSASAVILETTSMGTCLQCLLAMTTSAHGQYMEHCDDNIRYVQTSFVVCHKCCRVVELLAHILAYACSLVI